MTELSGVDLSFNQVSVHVDSHDEEEHTSTTEETPASKLAKRRNKIFTRVLVVAVVMMFVSIGSLAVGIYLLGEHKTLATILFLTQGGMGIMMALFPMGMYAERNRSKPNGRMTRQFNCCRISSIVWFSFLQCLTLVVVTFTLLAILLDINSFDTGNVIIYVLLIFGVVITILGLAIVCPVCCCHTVYDYTPRQFGTVWSANHQPNYSFTSETQAGPSFDNTREARPQPSAPPMNEEHFSTERTHSLDPSDRDQFYADRGQTRRGVRGRHRGEHRGCYGLDEPRDRSDGERSPRRSRGRGRGHGRGPSRGRYPERGRRQDHDERHNEHVNTFSDEPPSYEEVLQQMQSD